MSAHPTHSLNDDENDINKTNAQNTQTPSHNDHMNAVVWLIIASSRGQLADAVMNPAPTNGPLSPPAERVVVAICARRLNQGETDRIRYVREWRHRPWVVETSASST
ncbi:hypothetical protein EYZ11_009337 [Aspergillus tanneri]|uniref:Uncharacterized protein n=1 Tax=Aspergillus tanneri TaxID=1220188 RepID=A0A4S3JDL9_9EURO|nr:hypothetical protein EYZ11_009337 [Aspergillus tanneri]